MTFENVRCIQWNTLDLVLYLIITHSFDELRNVGDYDYIYFCIKWFKRNGFFNLICIYTLWLTFTIVTE